MNLIKIIRKISLSLFLFMGTVLGQQNIFVDFGATESENRFEISGWNTLIKSPHVSYSAQGPGGLISNNGVEEYDDYQGVQGCQKNFIPGERIVVTWYNTSATESYVIAARISFEDTDAPNSDGAEGMWYTMRSFEDYRNTYQEILPGRTVKTVFNITDNGVHATSGNHSVVNVNLHCEWFETTPKPHILCDKIELYNDADILPPSPVENLTAATITDSKVTLNWSIPADNTGVVEYLIYLNGTVEGYTRTNRYTSCFLEPATQYTFQVSALDYCGNESELSNAVTVTTMAFNERHNALNPAGFIYRGAFTLPEIFSYGGEAITYNPNGDGGESGTGAGDGYAGSLFISNLNNNENGLVGEISIPSPESSSEHNRTDLNEAIILQSPVNIRPTNINNWNYVDIWRNGLEFVESENRLYNSWTIHYTVNEEKRATISCCNASDLAASTKLGAWYVGNMGNTPLESATSDYIFEIPQTWADIYTEGRSMVTGRFRDGGLGGLGPTFYAFNKAGFSTPVPDSELPITTLLEYASVEGTDNYNFPNSINDYNHADAWRTGEWVEWENKSAFMIIGNKAHGDNWYGYQGENMRLDWIIADCPQPEFDSTDPDGKGWRAHSYMPMAIFYDPSDLAQVAAGTMETYEPQPYAAIRFDSTVFWGEKSEISSACYDAKNNRLYITEYNAPNNGWLLIHIFDYDASLVPVELNTFTASVSFDAVILNWQTETELNNYGFQIERRTTNTDWKTIGFVRGYGNSHSPKQYLFKDKFPVSGTTYYRLKQIDNDGLFEYSNSIKISVPKYLKLQLIQNYPNPSNPSSTIGFVIPETDYVTLKLYDLSGNLVRVLLNKKEFAGKHKIKFNAKNLASGIYFYRLSFQNTILTKKMIILK